MSDQNYRELHYIECHTFNGMTHVKMDLKYYMPKEAFEMFAKVLKKYTGTAVRMLICHRKENHELVKVESIGFDKLPIKKKKNTRF